MTLRSRSGTRTRTTKKDLHRIRQEPLAEEHLELDFQKGLKKAAELAHAVKARPVLIAVYGQPYSGKSHFISKMLEQLSAKKLITVGYHSTASEAAFESINMAQMKEDKTKPDCYLFHCGHVREKDNKKAPDFLSNKILGKKIDVSIAIYNPSMHEAPEGKFDLFVCNTGSYKKKHQP